MPQLMGWWFLLNLPVPVISELTMKLKFKCNCGKVLVADMAAAGKKAKCPNCGKVVQVPRPPEPNPAAPNVAIPKPAEPKKAAQDSDLGFAPIDDSPPPQATRRAASKPVGTAAKSVAAASVSTPARKAS